LIAAHSWLGRPRVVTHPCVTAPIIGLGPLCRPVCPVHGPHYGNACELNDVVACMQPPQIAKPGAHAAAVRTSSGSGSGSGSGWWSDAANNDAAPAMDAWQHQPTSPTSFLMADGCPLPLRPPPPPPTTPSPPTSPPSSAAAAATAPPPPSRWPSRSKTRCDDAHQALRRSISDVAHVKYWHLYF
jgi:hypothetical protein